MSRVVYANTATTADQDALRVAHQVRPVTEAEEGTGVNALPGGVFGFTYSPGLVNAPLFAVRRYRSYETHKLPSGETYVIGFAKAERRCSEPHPGARQGYCGALGACRCRAGGTAAGCASC